MSVRGATGSPIPPVRSRPATTLRVRANRGGAFMSNNETVVLWDEELLSYNLGDHPLDPVRVELTIALAREFGLLERPGVTVAKPVPADDARLETVHTADYIDAVKAASVDQRVRGYGLGSPDNPTFPGMHEASALIAGASVAAAE